MTTKDAQAALASLRSQLAEMLDPLDFPRSWTQRQVIEYEERRRWFTARENVAYNAMPVIAECEPKIVVYTRWRDHQIVWRGQLSERLVAIPTDTHDRAELGLQRLLRLSIARIDRNLDFMNDILPAHLPLDDLMAEAGYVPRDLIARAAGEAWLGCLPEVEHRLAQLIARRDAAQRQLDDALRDVPSTVTEVVTTS